ncbi:hypothetical protein [Microbacterium sp. W4I20]|uniref:hypothetical protein n=1 Tax=Microbacterium sp. W4I20 TaxID=3042262 RepID=UPI00277F982A|nr:hypothetical protein [Microbacterium sp. W4I20]MDQ0728837.1 hypothetical protein [Microbacterium sp. W4I20]
MTYISILPKSETIQARIAESGEVAMDLLFTATREVLGIPDNDIIVELHTSTTMAFQQSAVSAQVAPDAVLAFATSDQHLQPLFQALCDRVVEDWSGLFEDMKLEVWVSLIDASATNIEW